MQIARGATTTRKTVRMPGRPLVGKPNRLRVLRVPYLYLKRVRDCGVVTMR